MQKPFLADYITSMPPALMLFIALFLSGCKYEPVSDVAGEGEPTNADVPTELPALVRSDLLPKCDGVCSCDELTPTFNDTGATFAGDFPDTNLPDCNNQSDFLQDCNVGRDAYQSENNTSFQFTKVDENGDELTSDASDWSCVLDKRSGLLWEVKSPESVADFRDSSYTYSWRDDDFEGYSTANQGQCDEQCDTQSYLERINKSAHCGFSDWRLPDKVELHNLLNYNYYQPAIDTAFFPNTQANFYWTKSQDVDDSGSVWAVDFNVGRVAGGTSANARFVRAVRGEKQVVEQGYKFTDAELLISYRRQFASQLRCNDIEAYSSPINRYKQDDDGNVLDTLTGLIWQKCVVGLSGENCEQGEPEKLNWQQAFNYATEQNDLTPNANPWRLPSIKELQQNIEMACEDPPLNPIVFPNTPFGEVWSSTPSARNEQSSYQYQYQNSIVFYSERTRDHYVHLVRDCYEF